MDRRPATSCLVSPTQNQFLAPLFSCLCWVGVFFFFVGPRHCVGDLFLW